MSALAQRLKIRRIVLTGAIASITVVGTWYGAGLKIQKDAQQASEQRAGATPAARIAFLEDQKRELMAQRYGLERKLRQIEMRAAGATREESMAGQERKRGE
ncbi:hypothetical protein BJ875DRAFT_18105 [Amylocarpus encephaloides]|uniref:Uncharacterized protein n=1 Tax=Amylocarpus encephaloides TaxID=45428 RepID=A0A9P7YIH3_9HELO|nr:hypothetical protein BJ875DRAFT_18105 [Amylocarpus encephaloides]